MDTTFLDWLVADISVFGWHAQNWMLVIAVAMACYLGIYWISAERHKARRTPGR